MLIENFRGITNLEINDMKRFNLLVGRNNCGKTSVLEAIFLLSGMSNPQLPLNIHLFRDLILTSDDDFRFLFRNLDFAIPIDINGIIDNRQRKLKVTPLYSGVSQSEKTLQKEITNQKDRNISYTSPVRLVEGINLDFYINKIHYQGQIRIKESKIIPSVKNYKEELHCSMLTPKTSMVVNDKQMEGLLVQKKLDKVLNVLREIEPKILDIRMGAGNMIYVDIGKERYIPLNVMGDGMRKILTMIATIVDMKNGVILIDEIENGLHYTSLSVAWKAFFAACKEYDVQLIATTHSYECIEAFSKVYEDVYSDGDDIRLYRIDREEEKHKAFVSTPQVLKSGIEKEFEVR
ncbi:ATP-binding protein [Candidatus Poribacteria bacterium]|nr:ATP-binding protein [Candidatus Poribacteria bacterium]